MSKKLNIDSITNELEGSAFFPQKKIIPESPTPSKIVTKPSLTRANQNESYPVLPVPPVRDVPLEPLVPPVKRVMKQRHPFDIYRDQYESLQEIALEERKQGGIGSMSAMVREALDEIIAKKRKLLK